MLDTPGTAHLCGWCGRRLPVTAHIGRRRRYCTQSCRQRAYERRREVDRHGLAADAAVLSADELSGLADRVFRLRCAAEDLVTALTEGATPDELRSLADQLAGAARELERLRG